ncbi:hypothetical protein GCM10009677_09690 [Sphaerisporangium rubeum]|uniref:Lipoprotein n=1 Tax=Sphaerisporangium rubeum TaxID=321317 RepID=A0A7X0MAW9_9ACTN|nr:hypothetical protein [Sphaerisporangium rubeum]MBB6476524.1 hypothetical protein [Sphaerisporangium rubeum]
MTRTRPSAAFLLALLLGTAACAQAPGKDVASAGGSPAPGATQSAGLLAQGVRWARCLREHGVAQPDPEVVNGDGIRFGTYEKDSVDKDALKKAEQACKKYRPVLPAADMAVKLELGRLFARCMREEGVESYPDPEPDGGFDTREADEDPQAPRAREICQAKERSAAASARPSR